MTRLTRTATGMTARPCPPLGPAGLYSIKTDTLHPWLLLMSLALLTLGFLCVQPARAQSSYPGGGGYGYWDWTGGESSVSFSVAVVDDNRAVTISSSTIEDSYQKTNNPETFGRDKHVRDPSTGIMSVESVVTTSGGDFVISPSAIGDAFTANTLNFQHPYYTWSIPTAGGKINQYTQQYLGTESDQYVTIPVNINFGKGMTQFPVKSTLKVDVRDSDSATGSNTYDVTWHLPVESWSRVSSVPTTNRMYPDSGTDPDGKVD